VTYGSGVATVPPARAHGVAPGASLRERARRLSEDYLGGLARPASVRYVANQRLRWGSCTPRTGAIRLSSDLRGLPDTALDFVLLHELAHLIVPEHGPGFDRLVDAYPRRRAARAILEAQASDRAS
jgi:predicted metal-dependent hydrolase